MAQVPPIELVDVEKVLLSVAPLDSDGKPVDDGSFTWSTSDDTIVSLEVQADTFSAYAISGNLGMATVTVTDGTLTDTIDITIKHGLPTSLNLSAGTPIPE
jgi:hypothetical protein